MTKEDALKDALGECWMVLSDEIAAITALNEAAVGLRKAGYDEDADTVLNVWSGYQSTVVDSIVKCIKEHRRWVKEQKKKGD